MGAAQAHPWAKKKDLGMKEYTYKSLIPPVENNRHRGDKTAVYIDQMEEAL